MRKIRLLFIEDNHLFGEGVTTTAMLVFIVLFFIVLLWTSLLDAEDTPTPSGYIDPYSTTSLMVELLSKKKALEPRLPSSWRINPKNISYPIPMFFPDGIISIIKPLTPKAGFPTR